MKQAQTAVPAGMRAVSKRSVIPVLAVGAVWLLAGLLFPFYRVIHYIAALAVSAVVFFLLETMIPAKTVFEKIPDVHTGNEAADALLKEGRAQLARIDAAAPKIVDAGMRAQTGQVAVSCDRILDYVEKQPSAATQLRRFINYYLPTLEKLVTTYLLLEEQGVEGENISQAKARITAMLELMEGAFQKQLDALFDHTVLDVTSEISAMQTMMAQEGLTVSAQAEAEPTEENQIKLQF